MPQILEGVFNTDGAVLHIYQTISFDAVGNCIDCMHPTNVQCPFANAFLSLFVIFRWAKKLSTVIDQVGVGYWGNSLSEP